MDRRCRESEGKAKIEGYMSISDEEAHHRFASGRYELKSQGLTVASISISCARVVDAVRGSC